MNARRVRSPLRWIPWAAAGIPVALLLIVAAAQGFAPFGDKSVLIMDMSDQYVEFFRSLYHYGRNANPLFSWSKGLGQNNIGLFAYYIASPLSALILLFPESALTTALGVLTLVKIGCCGAAFAGFLRVYSGRWHIAQLPFACAYAMMSYNMVYAMSLMWLDGVIALPLMLIGVLRVLRANRPAVLLGSFAYIAISNYYIAYAVFGISFLFFLYGYFGEQIGARQFGRKLGICAAAIAAACGLGAVLLVPTLVSLLQGKMDGGGATASYVPFALHRLLGKLLPGQYDSITNAGLPSIYCGSAGLLGTALFFAGRAGRRAKIAAGLLLGGLLLSFCVPLLDRVWHVFQVPNWFPYRYAFGYCGLLLFFGYRGVTECAGIPLARKFGALSAGCAVIAFSAAIFKLNGLLAWSTAGLCVCAALAVTARRASARGALTITASVLLAVELALNANALAAGLDREFGYQSNASYRAFQMQLDALVQLASDDCDEPFYRIEKDFERSKNDAYGAGYNGITHYSSAYSAAVNRFTKQLGLAQNWFWNSYYGPTPVTDALLSVRYTMRRQPEIDDCYTVVGTVGDATLYRNKTVLPLATASCADPQVNLRGGNPLSVQQELLRQLTGTECTVWTDAVLDSVQPSGFTPSGTGYAGTSGGTITYRFRTCADGGVYAYFPGSAVVSAAVSVNGVDRGEAFGSESSHTIYLGSFASGETVTVTFRLLSGSLRIDPPHCATLDDAALAAAVSDLSGGGLRIDSFSATRVTGVLTAKADGSMYTSIPYDRGWTVRIDGKPAETFRYAGALLMTQLPAGTHTIEFSYRPVGFRLGLGISVLTLAGICVWGMILRKKRSSKSCADEKNMIQ